VAQHDGRLDDADRVEHRSQVTGEALDRQIRLLDGLRRRRGPAMTAVVPQHDAEPIAEVLRHVLEEERADPDPVAAHERRVARPDRPPVQRLAVVGAGEAGVNVAHHAPSSTKSANDP
jgi:hypothetical protein